MKVLYGIQGTGHGHISRAREVVPVLRKYAEVELLISGYACHIDIDGNVMYRKRGLSLMYNNTGGVSYVETAKQLDFGTFINDVKSLNLDDFDLIISDFEPVTAWAAKRAKRESIGMSHQAAFLSEFTPRPASSSLMGEWILSHFAPITKPIGFHFKRYDSFIEPPIIRTEVLDLSPEWNPYITVYLPAYDPELLAGLFNQIGEVEWEIFSPMTKEVHQRGNVKIRPVSNKDFLHSMEGSMGVLTGGGFETCAESLYLGKKLMVVPIANQYEQLCNAAALNRFGVPSLLKVDQQAVSEIRDWVRDARTIERTELADVDTLVREKVLGITTPTQELIPA